MPIYTFRCPECGYKVEKLVQKADETPVCTKCGSETKQVWSTPAVAQWKCSKGSL